jgi:dolichyldiphosphatase
LLEKALYQGAPSRALRGAHTLAVSSTARDADFTNVAAADADDDESMSRMPNRRRSSVLLAMVNESTKFVVSCAALAFLLLNPSAETCWALLGSVVNSVNGKVLKRVLNHERPDGAIKADPGMPSSHATSLSYLSVYGAASLVYFKDAAAGLGMGYPAQVAIAGALVIVGAFLSYLRVRTGYHTPPQVIVGYGLGSSTALAWLFIGLKYVKPLLETNPEMLRVLHSLLIIAIGWFAFSALHWVESSVKAFKHKVFGAKGLPRRAN